MHKLPLSPLVLAAAIGLSSLALTATAAQTDTATSPPTSAPMQHGAMHGMHGWMNHRGRDGGMAMFRKLDLTDAQRTQVRQITRDSFQQARPAMQALMAKRRAFEDATPGSAGYRTAAAELAQAEGKAAEARVTRNADVRAKIYDVLTPAQRTKLASLRSERQARMKQWQNSHRQGAMNPPASGSSSK